MTIGATQGILGTASTHPLSTSEVQERPRDGNNSAQEFGRLNHHSTACHPATTSTTATRSIISHSYQ